MYKLILNHLLAFVLFLVTSTSWVLAADCEPGDVLCDDQESVTQGQQTETRVNYPPYHGPKQVVAVLPFANRVRGVEGAANLGSGLSEILVTELVRSGRFLVVEREAIQDIVKEQELGMTGLVRKETAPKTGVMSGAQFMIKGAVTEFSDRAGGGAIALGFRRGEIGGGSRTAYVGIDVRIVDNATGQVYASYNAHAKAKSTKANVGVSFSHNSDNFKIGTKTFFSTPLGKATRQAVQKVMKFILEESKHIPWQGSVIKAGNRVYLNRGKSAGVKPGDRFDVFSKGEPLIDPETGFNLGSDEELICTITVSQVKGKFSIARQSPGCQGLSIKRGDIIRYR